MAKTNEGDFFTMIKAVIFDMDGTVIETSITHDFPSWAEVFKQHGVTLTYELFQSALGKKAREIILQFIPDIDEAGIQKFIEQRHELLKISLKEKGLETIPGVLELLDRLKIANIHVALATGSIQQKIDIIKEHITLDTHFPVIVSSTEVQRGKPSPDIFLKAAEKLGVQPDECIVIEDAPNGIEAAHAAGMKCVLITTTHKKEELQKADLVIDSFDELSVGDIIHLGGDRL